jgi:hypothetical protein
MNCVRWEMGWKIETKFFSNFKRKNFISKIVQTWLGAPKGGGASSQSRITEPSPCGRASWLLSSWLLFASPHPGGFTNRELPHQATWTPFLYIILVRKPILLVKWSNKQKTKVLRGRGTGGERFLFIFPDCPMCLHYVPFMFPMGSQYFPQIQHHFQRYIHVSLLPPNHVFCQTQIVQIKLHPA